MYRLEFIEICHMSLVLYLVYFIYAFFHIFHLIYILCILMRIMYNTAKLRQIGSVFTSLWQHSHYDRCTYTCICQYIAALWPSWCIIHAILILTLRMCYKQRYIYKLIKFIFHQIVWSKYVTITEISLNIQIYSPCIFVKIMCISTRLFTTNCCVNYNVCTYYSQILNNVPGRMPEIIQDRAHSLNDAQYYPYTITELSTVIWQFYHLFTAENKNFMPIKQTKWIKTIYFGIYIFW